MDQRFGKHAAKPLVLRTIAERSFFLALLLVAIIGTTLSLLLNALIFERIPHTEDEVAFLFQAATLARGHLVAPAPPVPNSFWIPFVIVRDNLWFGKYPPGYPAILALGVLVGTPWLVNPLAFGITVVLVGLLGRRLFGERVGLLAAALLTTSPFALIQSASFLAHAVCLLLTVLFLWSFALTLEKPSVLRALPGAAALALLILARPLTALGVTLPFILWSLLYFWRHPEWRSSGLTFTNAGMLSTAALLQYNARTTGNPLVFGYELWWPFDRVGFGPGHGPGEGENAGHTLANGIFNTRFNLHLLEQVLFGWPGRTELIPLGIALVVAIGGLLYGFFSFRRDSSHSREPFLWDLVLAAQVLSLVAVHIAYWTSGQMYGPRYYFEAVASLALLTARGLLHLWHGLQLLWQGITLQAVLPLRLRLSGLAVLLFLVSWGIIQVGLPWWLSLRGWYDITAQPAARVAASGIRHAIVFVPAERWTDYAPFFIRNSPWLDTEILYAWDHGPEENDLVRQAFPDRAGYRVDLATGILIPLW